ncbi:aldose 1-epimerase [Nonlabens xiamenensis]|uniref:aldose 1-epimerase n=1 Tax=Nonlabens xiamenensis TaxID=2341043 RepID=UPI000F613D42|nr:hypothetical protein [Nonlabens xiamenensis]
MYKTERTTHHHLPQLLIKDKHQELIGRISLHQGGSLQELQLAGHKLIQPVDGMTYEVTYPSAILFPFVNRIKDGKYRFRESEYQMQINDPEFHNALHGFVCKQQFEVFNEVCTENSVQVELASSFAGADGFPFSFDIILTYTWRAGSLELEMKAVNTGKQAFPFTLGWHPYFYVSDVDACQLAFNADQHFIYDSRQLPVGSEPAIDTNPMELQGKMLDDGYHLTDNSVRLIAPTYQLELTTDSPEAYLQLYRPPYDHVIAIEPMSGGVDAFNNGEGLEILEPGAAVQTTFRLKLL